MQELLLKHWPRVREVYLSPLSQGNDVITGWQIEVMLTGGVTEAWQAATVEGALEKAFLEL